MDSHRSQPGIRGACASASLKLDEVGDVLAHRLGIRGACASASNRLIDKPSKIISIGMRDWAHTGQIH